MRKRGDKKAVFFSIDALLALMIILVSILVVYPVVKYSHKYTLIHEDVIKVLSTLKTGDIDNLYVQSLISQGFITDLNKSILEQIGEFYVLDETKPLARDLAEEIFSTLNTSKNVGIWYGNDLIASKNSTPIETSDNIEVERQIISGVKEGGSVTGFSARAYLSNAMQKKYFYFGGYVGDGNISININYTGNIEDVTLEIVTNRDFKIFINGLLSGQYQNSSSVFSPAKYDLGAYATNFYNGENIMEFVGVGGNLYIAGGYIKIIYENSSLYEQPTRYYFPGIEGVINLYDGFYIPESLNKMKISLHYDSNYTTFLTIGDVTVFNSSSFGEVTEIIDNTELSSKLNYDALSRKTIPLRLGLYELQTIKGGNADVVLITDLSGSMNYNLNSDLIGVTRNCNNPNLYSSNTKRVSLAKCLDKMVIDTILNVSGNRLALSAFYGDIQAPYKGRVYEEGLTDNSSYLKSKIDLYNPQSGTCICCSINDAYKILNEQSNSSRNKFVIVMSDGIPTHTCQAASGCEGTRTGLPSDEGLWLGAAGCYGGSDDCNVNDCNCASQNANWSSCRVHNELKATVYSVGFGPVSNCQMANNTLRNIAMCGGGNYYSSSNASLLEEFYKSIAQKIVEISYIEQVTKITGDISTKLWLDSYIEFNYTKKAIPYGLIISAENQFYDDYYGNFSIPDDSTVLETKVVSYSGPRWTDNVEINNTAKYNVYNLSDYGNDYITLGDPYSIYIPSSFVRNNNTVKITTGVSPANSVSGSSSNKIIYTLIRDIVAYSPISSSVEGCRWLIEFEDGDDLTINIPSDYSGTDNCVYKESSYLPPSEGVNAIETATYNLLRLLDFDLDGKLDVKFTNQDFEVSSSAIVGIPYDWSTEVQVRIWS